MKKAIWKDKIIAQSHKTITLEGNQYFPADSIISEYFTRSDQQTVCHWKGTASYYDIKVDDQLNPGAAWYYSQPKPAASAIKDYVAF